MEKAGFLISNIGKTMTKSLTKKRVQKEKPKIYERNPDTGVIRWRYVGESPDKYGWPNYGRILQKWKWKENIMALSQVKQSKQFKLDVTDYQDVADCIRSDQVPANHIAEYFNDKKFFNWYKRKYLWH